MMGCNDGGDQIRSVQDSFNGRKLRPFMPITDATATSATRNHGTDHFLALSHHFGKSLIIVLSHIYMWSESNIIYSTLGFMGFLPKRIQIAKVLVQDFKKGLGS